MSLKNPENILKEIVLFAEYAVPGEDFESAKSFVERYQENPLILRLLHEHYSTLPADKEEAVKRIAVLKHKQGVYLFVVSSDTFSSLYLTSSETIVWLGEYGTEVNTQILEYFEFKNQKEFLAACKPVEKLQETGENLKPGIALCPVCNVAEGEFHLLGCIIEVCPWCDGQLGTCNCRFDQLKIDEIVDDEQLEEFYERLEAKGRIAFVKDQAPAYPGTSDGLDVDKDMLQQGDENSS